MILIFISPDSFTSQIHVSEFSLKKEPSVVGLYIFDSKILIFKKKRPWHSGVACATVAAEHLPCSRCFHSL